MDYKNRELRLLTITHQGVGAFVGARQKLQMRGWWVSGGGGSCISLGLYMSSDSPLTLCESDNHGLSENYTVMDKP